MIPLIILAIEDPDDRAFMEDLYLSYKWLMYAKIKGIVSDSWETEDIMQSSIEKLIDKVELLKTLGEEKKTDYIITTCRNEAFSYLRKKKPVEYVVNESLDVFESESDTPEVQILTKESIANTYKAWQMLDEKSKTLLAWKYKLEMSDVEIASELGIKPNSVRMRLTRARNRFKQQLRKLEMV